MLTREGWLKVSLGQHIKLGFQDRRGCLESGVGGWRGERQISSLDVFYLVDTTTRVGDDLHLVTEVAIEAGHDCEGYKAGTVDSQWV